MFIDEPRIIRGGGWDNDAQDLRSANRDSDEPGYRYSFLGFRLVRTRNSEDDFDRVIRGGGWVNDAQFLRSAFHRSATPNGHYGGVGFRLARVPNSMSSKMIWREIDALVAEKVMGGKLTELRDYVTWQQSKKLYSIPNYSTDMTVAWAIVEKFKNTGDYKIVISAYPKDGLWTIKAYHRDGYNKSCSTSAKTLPHAICLAALKSVGAL